LKQIIIKLKGNPVGKASVRVGVGGGYNTAETKAWMMYVACEARKVAPEKPLEGPVKFEMTAMFQLPKKPKWRVKAAENGDVFPVVKPDIDNIMKGVADGLSGIIWKDDNQVVEASLKKVYSRTPGVEVVVTTIEEPKTYREWKEW